VISSHQPLPTTDDTEQRPRVRFRKVAALAAVAALSGCLWHSYERVLTVHLDVLSSMATKLLDTAAAGKRPSPNQVTELLYPLHRARQFAQQYGSYSGRASYREFVTSLDFYEKLVDEVDAARADDQRWQTRRATLTAPAEAFLDQARRTREALKREE
jgi:hypothetical protein